MTRLHALVILPRIGVGFGGTTSRRSSGASFIAQLAPARLAPAARGGGHVVFRRDNKVDSFQRQMSALRHQLGNTGEEEDDVAANMPELDDDEFGGDPYRSQQGAIDPDAGAYS